MNLDFTHDAEGNKKFSFESVLVIPVSFRLTVKYNKSTTKEYSTVQQKYLVQQKKNKNVGFRRAHEKT